MCAHLFVIECFVVEMGVRACARVDAVKWMSGVCHVFVWGEWCVLDQQCVPCACVVVVVGGGVQSRRPARVSVCDGLLRQTCGMLLLLFPLPGHCHDVLVLACQVFRALVWALPAYTWDRSEVVILDVQVCGWAACSIP